MEDTYVRLINCRLHLFRSSASSFSSQYLLLFLKSSRSCVLLLPTSFTSAICPSIWPIQLTFLRRILFRSVLFSPIRPRTCSVVNFSDPFIFSLFFKNKKIQLLQEREVHGRKLWRRTKYTRGCRAKKDGRNHFRRFRKYVSLWFVVINYVWNCEGPFSLQHSQ